MPRTAHRPAARAAAGAAAVAATGAVLLAGAFHAGQLEPKRLWAAGTAVAGGTGDNGQGKNNGIGNDRKNFTISGSVDGLYPGARRPLTLTLRNTNNFPITVTGLTTSVVGAPAGCSTGSLLVPAWTGSQVVPKQGTATVTLQVRMAGDAPDDCKNATYELAYTGTATK